jgi:riboflavin kinase / FMN adenylyltransferase
MKLYRSIGDLTPDARRGVVVIGNFDGVHRGHLVLLDTAAALARDLEAPLVVMTFEPHPRSFFAPDSEPFRLTLFREKARQLQRHGVQHLLAKRFDAELANETAEDFVHRVLIDGLAARHVVVGEDFRFGKGRKGDPALLLQMLKGSGADFTALHAVGDEVGALSSSRIRQALQEGQPEVAAGIMGRPFELGGTVLQGAQRGRTIGFPTANLALDPALLRPAYGVYAVEAALSSDSIEAAEPEQWWRGVANFGKRPTVDGLTELFEVHLFDAEPALYDQFLRVRLCHFIRAERKFDSFDALREQIGKDAEAARTLLSA